MIRAIVVEQLVLLLVNCEFHVTKWSGFEAEYGNLVCNLIFIKISFLIEPKTSSVETCINNLLSLFNLLYDSRRLRVPKTLVSQNLKELLIELSTCDSAAKWKIISNEYWLIILLTFLKLVISIL